jgi:hypothetical protein
VAVGRIVNDVSAYRALVIGKPAVDYEAWVASRHCQTA